MATTTKKICSVGSGVYALKPAGAKVPDGCYEYEETSAGMELKDIRSDKRFTLAKTLFYYCLTDYRIIP